MRIVACVMKCEREQPEGLTAAFTVTVTGLKIKIQLNTGSRSKHALPS